MHLYWCGVAADLVKMGDDSLAWVLEEAASGPLRAHAAVAFDGMLVPLSALPALPLASALVQKVLATVTRRLDEGGISVSVADDGTGIAAGRLDRSPSDTGGFGLFNLRERMEILGGAMRVDAIRAPPRVAGAVATG